MELLRKSENARDFSAIDETEENGLEDDSFYERVDPARFEKLELLGMGHYASVYRAKDLQQNRIVAIKHLRKLTSEEEKHLGGDDLYEVNILSSLKHPNIISMVESFGDGSQKTLVMECMDFTLEDIIKDHTIKQFQLGQIKYYLRNIIEGLVYLHGEKITHRDLKPNNILLTRNGIVKISDFGASRRHSGDSLRTNPFACRYYRAPEILLGVKIYNQTVDMWALGCIVAEFYLRKPLFVGGCDVAQIVVIFEVLGFPKSDDFSEKQLEGTQLKFPDIQKKSPKTLKGAVPTAHLSTGNIMQHCFIFNPDKRWTSTDCEQYLNETEKELPCCAESELPVPKSVMKNHAVKTNCSRKRKPIEEVDHSENVTDLSINVSDTEDSPKHQGTGVKTPSSRLNTLRTPGKFQQKLAQSKVRRRLF